MMDDKIEVGDWVVFEEAKFKHPDLANESDWSHLNGIICIVTKVYEKGYIDAKDWYGDVTWPTGGKRARGLDPRHFRLLQKIQK